MIVNAAFFLILFMATFLCIHKLKQMNGTATPLALAGYVVSGTSLSLLTLCALLKLIL